MVSVVHIETSSWEWLRHAHGVWAWRLLRVLSCDRWKC